MSVGVLSRVLAVGIVDVLRPYAEYVLPIIFVGFFVAAAVAIAFGERTYVRKPYVASLVVGLLLVNVAFPVYPLPFMTWHKFSEPRATDQVSYQLRVVDSDGDEIPFEEKATLVVDGVSKDILRKKLREELSPAERDEVASYLLERSIHHRSHIRNRSLLHLLRFPPHGLGDTWTERQLSQYDEFVGIRMYRIEFETSPDGTEVTSYDEELVYEYYENGTAVPPSDASVTRPSSSRLVPAGGVGT